MPSGGIFPFFLFHTILTGTGSLFFFLFSLFLLGGVCLGFVVVVVLFL